MAKKKEIKYNILNKTANDIGTFYFIKDNVNYIGNSFAVVYGMNDGEFKLAIEKSKAVENNSVSDRIINVISSIKEKNKEIKYTRLCYDSHDGMVHFFRSEDGIVISICGKFFDIVKEMNINNIYGINSNNGVLFELTDGRDVLIMPCKVNVDNVDKIIEKMY